METVQQANSFAIDASVNGVAFEEIVDEVTTVITEAAEEKAERAREDDGEEIEVQGDELLIATGRKPDTDLWNVEAADLETNEPDAAMNALMPNSERPTVRL